MWKWSNTLDPNLKRVTEVGVRIDSTGLSMPQLGNEIEERLRQAGIAVVSPLVPGPDGTAYTLRMVIVVSPGPNESSLRTQVRLTSWGKLFGRGGRIVESRAWITETRSHVLNNAEIEAQARQDAEYLVGEFITAYRCVNQQS